VNDVRRMNVAITRARRSLWILGSLATLRTNKEWEALIKDAESRGVVVSPAHAQDMFPDMVKWKSETHDTPQQKMAKDSRLKSSMSASRPGDMTSLKLRGSNSGSSTMPLGGSHVPSATATRPIRPMSSHTKAPARPKPMRSMRSNQAKRERSLSPTQEPVQDAKKTPFPQLPTGR
jgi:senataxin